MSYHKISIHKTPVYIFSRIFSWVKSGINECTDHCYNYSSSICTGLDGETCYCNNFFCKCHRCMKIRWYFCTHGCFCEEWGCPNSTGETITFDQIEEENRTAPVYQEMF